MGYLLIACAALAASLLAFFSGFGLGTLLLPAFTLFVPVKTAVALTALVHLLNNAFRTFLVGRRASLGVVLRFGLPAVPAAFAGAAALTSLGRLPPIYSYTFAGREIEITPMKLLIAVLMAVFAALEAWPRRSRFTVDPKYLPLGGLLSGFFGGISGQQGAFRSVFLLRAGLDKHAFIATSSVISVMVDLTRLLVYRTWFSPAELRSNVGLLLAGAIPALAGTLLGSRLLHKVTLRSIQVTVAVLLFLIAVALALGLV